MSKFDDFKDLVLKNGKDLAKTLFQGFANNAEADAKDFLERTEGDLKRWTEAGAKGELSRAELEDLIKGRLDLAKMAALTQAGIAVAQVERFRSGLIKIVTDAAFDVFWPG